MSDTLGRLVKIRQNPHQFYLVTESPENPLGPPSFVLVPFNGDGSIQIVDSVSVEPAKWLEPLPIVLGLACLVAYGTFNSSNKVGQGLISIDAEFKPHQFRPLLKFISDNRQRILIADQTGLGKTIEAGYIISHEIMNGRASRILVICPSHLKQKWKDELNGRFGLSFKKLSGLRFGKYIEEGFPNHFLWIVSIDAARSFKGKVELLGSEMLDILVIDEVHNIIGRQGETLRRDFSSRLSSISRSVLGLSATPINIEETDLLRIFEIIRPGELSEDDFRKQMEINGLLNRCYGILSSEQWNKKPVEKLKSVLKQLDELSKGTSSTFHNDIQLLISEGGQLTADSDISDRLNVRKSAMRLNSFRHYMTRTTRAEAGEDRERVVCNKSIPLNTDTMSAKQAEIVSVSEESLYLDVDELLQEYFSHVHRRQLASSLYATRELIEGGVKGYSVWKTDGFSRIQEMDYLAEDEEPPQDCVEKKIPLDGRSKCQIVLGKYSLLQVDSKLECLRNWLLDLSQNDKITKCLVFTEWRPTIRYLYEEFVDTKEFPCFFVWGTQNDYERNRQIQRFKASNGFSVLFCSDVLSEGIDVTEANCVINYDMPYNPQKLEQRIGRVDRIGQVSDKVYAISIVIKESLDEKIQQLLLERIKAFEKGIGPLSAILVGQESVLNSLGKQEQNALADEFLEKWNLQNSPSLAVIDTPLEIIREEVESENSNNLDSCYWLALYPLLSSVLGIQNCRIDDERDGLLVSTDAAKRRVLAHLWDAEQNDIDSVFAAVDSKATLISSNVDKGRKVPVISELFRKASEMLLDDIYNPANGTLLWTIPDKERFKLKSDYLLMECKVTSFNTTERIFSVFSINDGILKEADLRPTELIRIMLYQDGLLSIDSNYTERILCQYPMLKTHFNSWTETTIKRDMSFFSAKEPDNIRLIKNRIPALKRRLDEASHPQKAVLIQTKLQEYQKELKEREHRLSSMETTNDYLPEVTIRCLLALKQGP